MANQTIVINNFGGRLTRILNGDLNSGFAKFEHSFGYDPFTKPMNLTWFGQPASIFGISDVVVGGTQRVEGTFYNGITVFVAGMTGKIFKIAVNGNNNPNLDSVVGITSINSVCYSGAGMEFYGVRERLYVSAIGDIHVVGSAIGANVYSLAGPPSIVAEDNVRTAYSPLKRFAGKLIFGNGPSIGAFDASGTVISSVFTVNQNLGPQFSQLNPPLPSNQVTRDLDVSPDGNYLLISASTTPSEVLYSAFVDDGIAAPSEGAVYGWNGVDQGVTTALTVPAGTATALQVYLQNNMLFLNDTFGAAVSDGKDKILSLPNNKSPLPAATTTNGNFLCWMNPEVVNSDTKRVASMYYFGSLDQENPAGLYRLLRYETTLLNGFVYQVPYNGIVSQGYKTVNSSITGITRLGLGKHYFSTMNVSSTLTSAITPSLAALACSFNRFEVTSMGGGLPQLGVYETQTQMFQKRIHVEQIRVYTESTVAGNGFQLDIVGADGTVITNGNFTYAFVAGSDITKLEGSLQRINFNPKADAGYGFGIRLTNTGTTNMTFKKVEVDWGPEGR